MKAEKKERRRLELANRSRDYAAAIKRKELKREAKIARRKAKRQSVVKSV